MLAMQPQDLRVALSISVDLFTTLGLGEWIPHTFNALLARASRLCLTSCKAAVLRRADLCPSG
jgi:hypothetical protein